MGSYTSDIQRPGHNWRRHIKGVNPVTEFVRLLESEIPRLRRYARALTREGSRADDLVQSSLLRAISKQHLWQAGTDLRAWLFTILHNVHVNEVRRGVREGMAVPVEEAASALTVDANAGTSLQLRDLDRALARMPDEQRQVILLVGLEGMRYEEVATVLGVPVGTIRSRLSRGRETLRRLVGIDPDEHETIATGARNVEDVPGGGTRRSSRASHLLHRFDRKPLQSRPPANRVRVSGFTGADARRSRRAADETAGTNRSTPR